MATTAGRRMSVQEYLALERASQERHELVDGEVIEMVGGSRDHNTIVNNLATELTYRLKGRACEVFSHAMRVRIPDSENYVYPDVLVTAGQAVVDDASGENLLNPAVVIEVLSPSTEAYDRGRKFRLYEQIDTLADYLLVSQSEMHIEHYQRSPGGAWSYRRYTLPTDTVRLESVDCQLLLAEAYAKVHFPPAG